MYVCKPVSKEEFLHLSYRDLRERTGIEIKHWSNWFNSKASPKFDTLERAARNLGMPLTDLVEVFVERRSRTIERKELG
jgi:transcriptional regulator with XRE-family HTH domain